MVYSFVISTSIKQIKGLELIPSEPFAFGSCCCSKISPYKWNKWIPNRWKQIHLIDRRNNMSGQISSLLHSEQKRTHQWAQQHKKAWTSTEENSGGWSEVPLHGKEKPLHNIQPREEYSSGGRRVTVKVYNQEKTSAEQIQRVHYKVQTRPD